MHLGIANLGKCKVKWPERGPFVQGFGDIAFVQFPADGVYANGSCQREFIIRWGITFLIGTPTEKATGG